MKISCNREWVAFRLPAKPRGETTACTLWEKGEREGNKSAPGNGDYLQSMITLVAAYM
jgi:hypothetical protein